MNFREAMFDQELLCEKFGFCKVGEDKNEGKIYYSLPSQTEIVIVFGVFERMIEVSMKIGEIASIVFVKEDLDEIVLDLSKQYPVLTCRAQNKDSKTTIEITNSPVPKISAITLMA